jgi:hypothetical protein
MTYFSRSALVKGGGDPGSIFENYQKLESYKWRRGSWEARGVGTASGSKKCRTSKTGVVPVDRGAKT